MMEIIKKKCDVKGCDKVIEGTNKDEVEHNLAVHKMTHKRIKKNGERREV